MKWWYWLAAGVVLYVVATKARPATAGNPPAGLNSKPDGFPG